MKNTHIAFVSHRFQKNDGQGRVNYEIVRAALRCGYRVTVLATTCAPEISEDRLCEFVQIGSDRLPTELARNVLFATQSTRWLKKHAHKFDLIQANGFVTWFRADVVAAHFVHSAWARSKYYPFRSFTPYHLYQRLYTWLNSRWETTAYSCARQVIAVSGNLPNELAVIGVRPERITVIRNGVDIDQFEPGTEDRQVFGLPSAVPLALFVGDIRTPRKNLDTVLRAMPQIPSLHLVVAGATDGSPYPDMAAELGLRERVHFLGKTSQIPLLMQSVDLFVFPSRYEAHPLVLLEAMASGLPSVVSGTFGASDFIGGSGIILEDPDNADGLSRALAELVNDPGKRRAMGLEGRRLAEAMSWDVMSAAYLNVYEKLLATK